MEMFQQLFAVAGVLGALCIVVWAMKRKGWARIALRGPRGVRDAQTRLEVLDRLVLVGLSPNGCNLLESSPATGILPPGVDR
jgi:hypothetical protein